jgi:hypothetical protein
MSFNDRHLSPGRKAHRTAQWARIMTKWLVTYSHRRGARWNVVDFGGKTKAESRGIVDLLAIRKDHREGEAGLKRGDHFEMVLIQTKGGTAPRPTPEDIVRLSKVARFHKAKAVVLIEWQRKDKLMISRLNKTQWQPVNPVAVFG